MKKKREIEIRRYGMYVNHIIGDNDDLYTWITENVVPEGKFKDINLEFKSTINKRETFEYAKEKGYTFTMTEEKG